MEILRTLFLENRIISRCRIDRKIERRQMQMTDTIKSCAERENILLSGDVFSRYMDIPLRTLEERKT